MASSTVRGLRLDHVLLVAVAFVALTTADVLAQADTTAARERIVLTDGSSVTGVVVEETGRALVVRTEAGATMTIPADAVRSRELLDDSSPRFDHPDPAGTRLFFAPTARPLSSGSVYLAVYEVFFPFAAVGVGDVLTLAGGVSILPFTDQLLYAAPKVTVYNGRRSQFALGLLAGTVTGESEAGGLLYGLGSFGTPERAVTLGLGFAFGGGDVSDSPALVLGGELQLSNRTKLITENYVLPAVEEGILLSGGVRFFGEQLAADVALLTAPAAFDEEGFPFFPWLGISYTLR